MQTEYAAQAPTRAEIEALSGPVVLDFGTNWCGHCRAAAPHVAQAFEGHERVAHLKVEDGSGRPLGRSFHVTLWPTLVFLRDGAEVARVVRPRTTDVVSEALSKIAG